MQTEIIVAIIGAVAIVIAASFNFIAARKKNGKKKEDCPTEDGKNTSNITTTIFQFGQVMSKGDKYEYLYYEFTNIRANEKDTSR
jgi:hypothetical protein